MQVKFQGEFTVEPAPRSDHAGHLAEWLEHLNQKFLLPWGYALNGEVSWEAGEEIGKVEVIDGAAFFKRACHQ